MNIATSGILARPIAKLRKPRLYLPSTDRVFYVLKKTLEAEYELTLEDLSAVGRKKEYVYMRQVIMALLNRETKWIDRKIAGLFGLDHSTMHHAVRQVDLARQGYDEKLRSYYDVFNNALIKAGHYELKSL